jgi:hypothetical protein
MNDGNWPKVALPRSQTTRWNMITFTQIDEIGWNSHRFYFTLFFCRRYYTDSFKVGRIWWFQHVMITSVGQGFRSWSDLLWSSGYQIQCSPDFWATPEDIPSGKKQPVLVPVHLTFYAKSQVLVVGLGQRSVVLWMLISQPCQTKQPSEEYGWSRA